MKTLIEGKDYSVHEYITKNKRTETNRVMCPICSNCNHKEFCSNRKKLFKMKECKDCSKCLDKEHCDKFYIYKKYKVELLTNGRNSTTKDFSRLQFNGNTKDEALNKMLEYIKDVSIHGKLQKAKETDATIVSICEEYENKRVKNKEIKPNTYGRNMQTIKSIGNNKFANIPIQNVTVNQIKQYLESERVKSNSSIDKYYRKIKNAYSIAYAKGIIQNNLFLIGDGIKKPESFKEDKKVDAFTRKEEYILTEYIKTHESKYNLILLVALYTGMRIGEILALRPSDIHIFGNIGSIEVKRTLTKDIHNKVVIGEITKTKNGLRTIDLTPLAVPIIQKALAQYKENKYDVLFCQSNGKFYTDGQVNSAIVGLTKNMKQPISVFSKIHFSTSKDYISANSITFEGIDKVIEMLNKRNLKGIFVNDRGYDSNEIFRYYFEKQQYFVIRLKENRKVYLNHKTYKITTIRDSGKGKIKMKLMFQGEEKECYASVLKVQITAKKKWINLVLVYGLGETPMMLASNIPIKSKEDVIKVVRCYLNRWK